MPAHKRALKHPHSKHVEKEIPMSLKASVERMSRDVTGTVEHLPARAEHARRVARSVAKDVAKKASAFVRENPGRALVGAFVIGFAISQVAKRA
jgi:ElaB/YqjD/DUF883 family membrane-anchored ribosome-binding protein